MSLNQLPKQGTILLRDVTPCDYQYTLLSLVKGSAFQVVCVPEFSTLLSDRFSNLFGSTVPVPFDVDLPPAKSKFTILADFDVVVNLYTEAQVAKWISHVSENSCLIIPCPTRTVSERVFNDFALTADLVLQLSAEDDVTFISQTMIMDRKRRPVWQKDRITLRTDGSLQCVKLKADDPAINVGTAEALNQLQKEFDLGLNLRTSEQDAKSKLELPFVSGRHEDGVLIRDGSQKKVRAGGQVIYAPDREDDLDDSDPDDDLNV